MTYFRLFQVATGSGIMSHFVNLNIVVPEAFILGGPGDHHVDIGSPIHLICVIEKVSNFNSHMHSCVYGKQNIVAEIKKEAPV